MAGALTPTKLAANLISAARDFSEVSMAHSKYAVAQWLHGTGPSARIANVLVSWHSDGIIRITSGHACPVPKAISKAHPAAAIAPPAPKAWCQLIGLPSDFVPEVLHDIVRFIGRRAIGEDASPPQEFFFKVYAPDSLWTQAAYDLYSQRRHQAA